MHIYLMQYNHSLRKYFHDNPSHIHCDDENKIKIRIPDFWVEEETFIYIIENIFPRLLKIWDLKGSLIQDARPDEDLTGSLPSCFW